MRTRLLPLATFLLAAGCAPAAAQYERLPAHDAVGPRDALTARAELRNPQGERVGEVLLTQTPNHGVLLQVRVDGLAPGPHGFHIHETGICEAPGFQSAGGHYAPRGRAHGIWHPEGKHAGDLLNLVVPTQGTAEGERLADGVTLMEGAAGTLFDEDGSAIVIHAGPDDYRSQPSGDAGGRVACGVVGR